MRICTQFEWSLSTALNECSMWASIEIIVRSFHLKSSEKELCFSFNALPCRLVFKDCASKWVDSMRVNAHAPVACLLLWRRSISKHLFLHENQSDFRDQPDVEARNGGFAPPIQGHHQQTIQSDIQKGRSQIRRLNLKTRNQLLKLSTFFENHAPKRMRSPIASLHSKRGAVWSVFHRRVISMDQPNSLKQDFQIRNAENMRSKGFQIRTSQQMSFSKFDEKSKGRCRGHSWCVSAAGFLNTILVVLKKCSKWGENYKFRDPRMELRWRPLGSICFFYENISNQRTSI